MNGTTVLSESYVDTVPDTGYQIVGSGDYNGDDEGRHPVAPRDARAKCGCG